MEQIFSTEVGLSSAARTCSHKYTFKQQGCADWDVSPAEYIYHVPVNILMAAINLTTVSEVHVMTREITREDTIKGRISFGPA